MKAFDLWQSDQADLSNLLIHFVGRWGTRVDEVPDSILQMSPFDRVLSIVLDRAINAFPVFGLRPTDAVVCFTECTRTGVETLIRQQRYASYGLAFTKNAVFQRGGGPAFYVRGDEWPDVRQMPDRLRIRATRFWPGARVDQPGETLPSYISDISEWTHEREWRISGEGDPPAFEFNWNDLAFVMLGDRDDYGALLDAIEEFEGEAAAGEFQYTVPLVEVDPDTLEVWDPSDAWK